MKPYRKYIVMICLVAVSLRVLFTWMQWPGASEMLQVASILFLIYAATESDKLNLVLGTLAALALALGLFFRIQLWPGAGELVILSLSLLLPAYLVVYFVRTK